MYEGEVERARETLNSVTASLADLQADRSKSLALAVKQVQQLKEAVAATKTLEAEILKLHEEQDIIHTEAKRRKLVLDEVKKELTHAKKINTHLQRELERVQGDISTENEHSRELAVKRQEAE